MVRAGGHGGKEETRATAPDQPGPRSGVTRLSARLGSQDRDRWRRARAPEEVRMATADTLSELVETAPAGLEPTACPHHGCLSTATEEVLTLASAITVVRTLGCLVAVTTSIGTGAVWLLFVGLGVHWLGDMADGLVARRWRQETRAGAVLDIVSDRLCIALYYVSYGHLHHDMLVPVAVFLFQFMVLDAHLSLSFLGWPLRSLNYFALVDRTVYRWNWSAAGKAVNGGALVAAMLVTRSAVFCTALALTVAAVKVGSLVRVHRAGVPAPTGCAAPPAS
jgi:CDP-diacylglycerol--glycerol-3-phosphate 3-phosphatidyltransferase